MLTARYHAMKTDIRKWADAGKLVLAGALFGLAVVNTALVFLPQSVQVPDSAEKVGMGVGAVIFALIVKALHIV